MGIIISLYKKYMNKNKNVMASYDPMTATDHNMLENMEESTYEMTKSHAKRVDNLYSRIRNIKIKMKRIPVRYY